MEKMMKYLFSRFSSPSGTNRERFQGASRTRDCPDELSDDDEARFEAAVAVIKRWCLTAELGHESSPMELVAMAAKGFSPAEIAEYLLAVDEIIHSSSNSDPARSSVLRIAISRLKDEFRHLVIAAEDHRLIDFIQRFTFFSSRAITGNSLALTSSSSSSSSSFSSSGSSSSSSFASSSSTSYFGDLGSSTYESYEAQAASFLDKEYSNPFGDGAISSLRDIVDRIVRAGYRLDLCELFIEDRLWVVKNHLALLGLGCISIKDDKMVRNWILALKVVRVVFSWEAWVCHHIFAAYDEIREECSVKVIEHCMIELLESAERIANLQRNASLILEMTKMLMNAQSGLLAPFSGPSRETISRKLDWLLTRLTDAVVKSNLEEYWNRTQTAASFGPKQSRNMPHIALSRLKDEFRHIVVVAEDGRLNDFIQSFTSSLHVDTSNSFTIISSSSSSSTSSSTYSSIISEYEGTMDEHDLSSLEERAASFLDEDYSNPICNGAISSLRKRVDRIVRAGYSSELCKLFIKDRRRVVENRLALLGLGSLSIEEDTMVRNWILAMKVVHVVFSWEAWVCNHIFAAYDELKEECLVNVSAHCIMELLGSTGEIVTAWDTLRALHLCETLMNAQAKLLAPFSGASWETISKKLDWLLTKLRDAVKYRLEEIGNTIRAETAASWMRRQSSGIHQQTSRLMYKLVSMVHHTVSLNILLLHDDDLAAGERHPPGDNLMTPFGRSVLLLVSFLEAKLEEISKFYEHPGLQNIFMMNNVWYIIKKVSNSELKEHLGDDWVRDREGQIEHHIASYITTSWAQVMYYLEVDGMRAKNKSGTVSRVKLRKGIKKFNWEFKEICKIQTLWKIPDPELRGKLRKAVCGKLIPAYQSFFRSFGSYFDDEQDAELSLYTPKALGDHLAELFEG